MVEKGSLLFEYTKLLRCHQQVAARISVWVGRGRGRKSTRPGATGVVELTPLEFLDRLADLVPPPRKQRPRYHGVFAPNHKLRRAVTSLAIGNVGKRPRRAGIRTTGAPQDAAATRSRDPKAPLPRYVTDCLGQADSEGGGGVSARVPSMRRRQPADRLHHGAGADLENPHESWRTARATTGVTRPWPAQ